MFNEINKVHIQSDKHKESFLYVCGSVIAYDVAYSNVILQWKEEDKTEYFMFEECFLQVYHI